MGLEQFGLEQLGMEQLGMEHWMESMGLECWMELGISKLLWLLGPFFSITDGMHPIGEAMVWASTRPTEIKI
jgi:hypothetical protein